MPDVTSQPRTGLLLSGGIDSAILLDQLLRSRSSVVPFYVETGSTWQANERNAIDRFISVIASDGLESLVTLEMPLADLYTDHWSISGDHVPDDSTPDEAVFMPGRNPLLLIKPALWCRMHGVEQLALATLAANPFPDATPAFFAHFEAMLHEATEGHIHITRPFEHLTKGSVLELGRHLPLELTFSCLSPMGGLHCGQCNKCAERRRAFQDVGIEDRTSYFAEPKLRTRAP
jgi:7-cyano-7-deazaguanine synthase